MLTDEYIAGFFDGEGCVSINTGGRCTVSITQKNPAVLYLIQAKYGGNVRFKDNRTFNCYNLIITNKRDILKFLKAMLPLCVVKKQEVEIGIEAAERINSDNPGCTPLTVEERAYRMSLRAKMQALKPKKTFCNLSSQEALYRQKVKEDANWLCNKCGKDLKETRIRDQVVSQDKLWCRACAANRYRRKLKPITKERLEEVLNTVNTLEEACNVLDIGRSALFQKRKEYGLPNRIMLRGKKYSYI